MCQSSITVKTITLKFNCPKRFFRTANTWKRFAGNQKWNKSVFSFSLSAVIYAGEHNAQSNPKDNVVKRSHSFATGVFTLNMTAKIFTAPEAKVWKTTYFCPSLPVEHRLSTTPCHRTVLGCNVWKNWQIFMSSILSTKSIKYTTTHS